MEGVHVVGFGPGVLEDESPPVGVRGQSPGRGLRDKVPQKLKQK